MDTAKRIKKLEKELQELEDQREAEERKARENFVTKGKLIVSESEHNSFYAFPDEFRRIYVSLEYTNAREALEVGIHVTNGGMTYYYLESWIVGIGGGTMILDVPCKATEKEWQSIIDGDVPRKFLRDWIKKIVK